MDKNFIFKNIEEAEVESLNLSWDQLEVSESLIEAIRDEFEFEKMTPVQAATVPLMLGNKDVIVEAKTGSGKTLAFLIPIVEALLRRDSKSSIHSHDVLALILSPTRELATQIHQELRKLVRKVKLSNGKGIVNQLIVGGSSVGNDIMKYTKYGANIIVATPGRLSAILEMSDNKLSSSIRKKLAYLIFDEADQLLSFGFEKNLSSILAYLPKQRRTSLFSATQTSEVDELVKSGLRNPIRVNLNRLDYQVKTKSNCELNRRLQMPDRLSNYYHVCKSYDEKLGCLLELIRTDEYKKMLVFLSTCSQIDYFSQHIEKLLSHKKVCILKLHRRLKNKRKAIFQKFKTTKRSILLVTDILSRGIDVPDISCVIHLDLPTSPECYVHRSGRSGHQIELSGISLLLLEKHELDYIEMCRRRNLVLHPMNLKHLNVGIEEASNSIKSQLERRVRESTDHETLAIQAFVSYIRFYSSKLCLRDLLFPRLPIVQLAKSFGLKRLPKMPELRKNHKSLVAEFKGATGRPQLDDQSVGKLVDANGPSDD